MVEQNSFENAYVKEKCYWGLKPIKLVENILKYKKSGKVLDLGVGEGRNVIFLAKNGFDVTGIDISEAGIEKFKSLAKELNVKVKGTVTDITKFNFETNYDIIISIATLHFLQHNDIKNIIFEMQKHTTKGGLNIISVFTEDNPAKAFPHLFKKNELTDFYKDWEILEHEEYTTPLEKHGKEGKLHKHAIADLIARKI